MAKEAPAARGAVPPLRPPPWGLAEVFGSAFLTVATLAIGGRILAIFLHPSVAYYLNHDPIEAEIGLYQFLVLGIAASAVLLIAIRYSRAGERLGFYFPGWSTIGLAAISIVPIYLLVA